MNNNLQSIDTYAVMGNPVQHSISPTIHKLFAEQTDQVMSYSRILVELDGFVQAIEKFYREGGKGLNITLPFKQQAWEMATKLSSRAELAKAVNTLYFKDDEIFGDNTDGIGLCRDIEDNLKVALGKKSILIVGAGGATRGILGPILERNPKQLTIANRTPEKAIELASAFESNGHIHGCGLDQLTSSQFDIIINGTSATLSGKMPNLPNNILAINGCCYDLAYGQTQNVFLEWGKQQGAKVLADGIGMLVEQAAESFYIWRGVRPQAKKIIEKLKSEIS